MRERNTAFQHLLLRPDAEWTEGRIGTSTILNEKQACGLEKSMVFEDQIVKCEFSPHKKAAPCGFLSPKAHVINCLLYFFLSAVKGSAGQRCAGCQQSHEPKGDIADITGPRDI